MTKRWAFALFLAVLPSVGHAANVAANLFEKAEHDFGAAPRGERLVHRFPMTNQSSKEIRIKGVRVSCGCTTATASVDRLAPGESGHIEAVMDTTGFQGNKSVTIFVQFDRPWRQEATLRVSCLSTGKTNENNSEVDFGVVPIGSTAIKKLNLDYSGNPKWEVVGLDFGHPSVRAEVVEISRDASMVRYELTITLADNAPAGPLEDKIRLHTNDSQAPEVTVLTKATIEPKLSASPDNLRLATLKAGEKVTKNVILKAGSPFKVVRVENTRGLFEIRSSPEAKKTQLLVVNLTVPEDPTTVPDHLEVITDLPDSQSISIGVRD